MSPPAAAAAASSLPQYTQRRAASPLGREQLLHVWVWALIRRLPRLTRDCKPPASSEISNIGAICAVSLSQKEAVSRARVTTRYAALVPNRNAALLAMVIGVAACGTSGDDMSADAGATTDAPAPRVDAGPLPTVFGGARPVTLHVPTDYDPVRAYPVLLVLHGAGITGDQQLAYFGFERLVEEQDTLLLAPNGTLTGTPTRWWDFIGDTVDDAGYLFGVLDEVALHYNVDPRRVYAFGHSNGAAMSHELACLEPSRFAAIGTLAHGVRRQSSCGASAPVSVLQLHGDADAVVPYGGQPLVFGAVETVETWASRNGCQTARDTDAMIDLDTGLPGDDTRRERSRGCPSGVDVELWTIVGGAHIPSFDSGFPDVAWQWLAAHPKP